MILILLSFFSGTLFAQQNYALSGTVTDEGGKPLSAASVYLSQSQRGTITNEAGKFSLSATGNGDTLTVSYMGYETAQIKITLPTDNVHIRLKQAVFTLGEVVVSSLSAAELLKSAVRKIPDNYAQTPFMVKAYYRAKASEKNTLLYMEETAFHIIKSYQPGFADKYFLEKNRNFRFVPHNIRWRGIAGYDYVTHHAKVFDNAFFRNRDISYLPSTAFDNRLVYVLSVSPKKRKDISSKIYIDSEDLAFVRFEYEGEDGNKRSAQYKKIDGKYYLMSGYSLYLNKYFGNIIRPAESHMITTEIIHNFSQENVKGIPVYTTDILETYAQQQDTLFWKEHNALLPDSAILSAMNKIQSGTGKAEISFDSVQYQSYIKRLYRPSVSLSFSSDWTKDFASLNQNSVSVSQTINYLLMDRLGFLKGAIASIVYYSLSAPFEEALSEQRLLNVDGLKSKMNPTLFNTRLSSYVFGVDNSVLTEYKANHYGDFMHLHTIRKDGHWVKAHIMEDELAQVDLSNQNNKRSFVELYGLELFLHRFALTYNPFSKDKKTPGVSEDKQPVMIDRDKSWVKYLFEPEAEYNRHIRSENLTKEERSYLKRSAWLSWINIFSPQMFGIGKFALTHSVDFTFSLNYLRTPFGEMFGQTVYLATNHDHLHGIYLKQYRNHEATTWGIGYKLFNLKLFKDMSVTSTLDYWKQPSGLQFYSKSFAHGFHIGQMLEYNFSPDKYTRKNRISLLIGYDFKTDGYLPQSYYLGQHFDVKAGFKWYFSK
ncbi:MAG: carboxypeptidase-like regulatory domain-containing protein [Tannerellaceae bacterium]|nr:carboxypeptidase-like regulatory domain-containing protein [Tannerellaceae bacterium]